MEVRFCGCFSPKDSGLRREKRKGEKKRGKKYKSPARYDVYGMDNSLSARKTFGSQNAVASPAPSILKDEVSNQRFQIYKQTMQEELANSIKIDKKNRISQKVAQDPSFKGALKGGFFMDYSRNVPDSSRLLVSSMVSNSQDLGTLPLFDAVCKVYQFYCLVCKKNFKSRIFY